MAGPFQPKTWLDFPSILTPISAAALNDLENRINTEVASLGSDGKIGGPGGSPLEGTIESTANKDVANGYAGLDSGGTLKLSEFPVSVVSDSSVDPNSPVVATTGGHALRDIKSPKDPNYGCKWNGTTDDTTNLTAAVADAITHNYALYAPAGTALTTASIPNIHSVSWFGPGKVKRVVSATTYTFTLQPNINTSNVVYVSTAGSDTLNDGLTPSHAFATLQQALSTIELYGAFANGKWQVQVAAGTFSGAASQTLLAYTNRDFTTFYPLQILGPNVPPQLALPAGLTSVAAGAAVGGTIGAGNFPGGQSYFVGITAYNANGETPISNIPAAVTPGAGPGTFINAAWSAVTGGTSTVNSGQAASAAQSITGYKVYLSTTQNGLWTSSALVGTVAAGTTQAAIVGPTVSAGAAPAANTTGSLPTAIFDGTGQASGAAGINAQGNLNIWLYNLMFQSYQGNNSNPSRGFWGNMNSGNLRLEDCCYRLSDFGCDGLNTIINVFGNTQFLNNTTNGWGFGLETKKMGWISTNSTANGAPLWQGNLIGIYVAEASDAHPTAGYVDNNTIGIHVSRASRFEADALSISRNTTGAQVSASFFEDVGTNWWDGTGQANTTRYDLRQMAAQADNGGIPGLSERYRCIDAAQYVTPANTSNNKLWDSNTNPPQAWQIPPNFLNQNGHRLRLRVYGTCASAGGTKTVSMKLGGITVSGTSIAIAAAVTDFIYQIDLYPTGAANANTQTVTRLEEDHGGSPNVSHTANTVALGGATVSASLSVQLFVQLAVGTDSVTIKAIELSEI